MNLPNAQRAPDFPSAPPPFFFTLPPTSPPQIPPNSLFSRSLALTTRQPVCIRSCTTLSLHILLHTLVCTHTLTGQLPKSHIHTRTTQDVQSSSELYAIFFLLRALLFANLHFFFSLRSSRVCEYFFLVCLFFFFFLLLLFFAFSSFYLPTSDRQPSWWRENFSTNLKVVAIFFIEWGTHLPSAVLHVLPLLFFRKFWGVCSTSSSFSWCSTPPSSTTLVSFTFFMLFNSNFFFLPS